MMNELQSQSSSDFYYSIDDLNKIWPKDWFEIEHGFRQCRWFHTELMMKPASTIFQAYHPYACHICKRCELTKTKLLVCASCRVVKYCSKEHQLADWKFHKKFCKAFKQIRQYLDLSEYADRSQWSQSLSLPIYHLRMKLGSDLLHTDESQMAAMFPRCRKCFKAGLDPKIELITCPKCCGVALCKDCCSGFDELSIKEKVQRFHWDSKDPTIECHGHLLSLCCSAMVVEFERPLSLPSNSDVANYWRPKDWREYFHKKRSDFDVPAPQFLQMAPALAFITDSNSTNLSIQHILGLPEVDIDAQNLTKLVVHMCGASAFEEGFAGKYAEMTHLNPQLKHLEIHLIGPSVTFSDEYLAKALLYENIRSTCHVSIKGHTKLYHEVQWENQSAKKPTIVFLAHSGLEDRSYTSSWKPTIELLCRQNVLFVLTGYNHEETIKDTKVLESWGVTILVPPTLNPFCGLRPFLDPTRDPNDLIYSNCSFVVAKGGNLSFP